MSNILFSLLGVYTMQFMILLINEFDITLPALLFMLPLRKRRGVGGYLLLSLVMMTVMLLLSTLLRVHVSGMGSRITVTLCQFSSTWLLLYICCDESWETITKTWCASIAVMEITAHLFSFILMAAGTDDTKSISLFADSNPVLDWGIYYAIHLLCYLLLFFLLGRNRPQTTDQIGSRNMTLLALFSLILLSIIDSITSAHRTESATLYMAARLSATTICFFILLIRAGIITQGQQRAEMAAMEQVMREQRRQYDSIRENINIVNMRCHDLKHQLANLSGKLTDEEVKALQEAMTIYDSTIKTGSEVLDVVLYEYQLTCQQEHIQLSCMADGKALSFMRTRHVYALFSNALRNAVEAVRQIPNEEKRIISVNVEKISGRIEIAVSNYCEKAPDIVNGLPATTKEDSNHHGFGTMSMRYIAEQYNGTMTTEAKNDLFTLSIILPLPSAQTDEKP